MLSEGGVLFGIINIVGNFGTVFVDQSVLAVGHRGHAEPRRTKGYLLGRPRVVHHPLRPRHVAMGLAGTVAHDVAGHPRVTQLARGLVPPAIGHRARWVRVAAAC
jgi:hypothetical protein